MHIYSVQFIPLSHIFIPIYNINSYSSPLQFHNPAMLNEETSTAALIPFDRLFRLTAADLNADYRVNLFSIVNKENSELLGMFGGGNGDNDEGAGMETEAEAEDEDGDNEIEDKEREENVSIMPQTAKKKRKLSKKAKELEYDLDDPFIDDSEITGVYQSVFELMRSGGKGEEEEEEEDNEGESGSQASSTKARAKAHKTIRNYFVYRGTMTPEILSKEFEIDAEELMEVEAGIEEEDEASDKDENIKKRTRSGKETKAAKKQKVQKDPKEPKEPKKPKVQKERKEPKSPKKKPATVKNPVDLISQSAKKLNDIFSTDDAATSTAPVFNVTGVDANLLELRETLKRFRDSAVGTPFSPGKFPSALRPKLNETLCSLLRCSRPSLQSPLPPKFFPALASFLPFSPAALNKLLTRKILGPLIEAMERTELPKMYASWESSLRNRIKEDGSIIVVSTGSTGNATTSTGNNVTTTGTTATTGVTGTADETIPVNPSIPTISGTISASPLKKKLKFSDEMRQLSFEILRTEIDVNNLICLSNTLEASASASGTVNEKENMRVAQSELNLRRNVYQKLASFSEFDSTVLLSTTEISKEFGAQKRKHDKRVAKAASEILFGEAEIEEFLKELDVPKDPKSSAAVAVVASNVEGMQTSQPADPLNLFANEHAENTGNTGNANASNTSLFIDSTN